MDAEMESRPSPSKVARVDKDFVQTSPQELYIEMAKLLLPLSENKSLPCNVPGCGTVISHGQMTSHFKAHFDDYENKPVAQKPKEKEGMIMFKCEGCGKGFKFRRALDNHLNNCSVKAKNIVSKKILLDSLFSSDSDSESETPVKRDICERFATKDIVKCNACSQEVKSEWHLPPNRHNCSLMKDKSEIVTNVISKKEENDHSVTQSAKKTCWKKVKGVKSKEFVNSDSESDAGSAITNKKSTTEKNSSTPNKEIQESPILLSDAKQVCPKCNEVFGQRNNLKAHLAVTHYKERLFSIYCHDRKSTGDPDPKCSICEKSFPKNHELLKHIGRAHEGVIIYLLGKDGLKLPPKQRAAPGKSVVAIHHVNEITGKETIKTERSKFKCHKCETEKSFSSRQSLKKHIGLKHYNEKLSAAYPGRKCSICDKECINHSELMTHVTIKHEKVLAFLLGKEGLALPARKFTRKRELQSDGTWKWKRIYPQKRELEEPPKTELKESPKKEDGEKTVGEDVSFGPSCLLCSQDISRSAMFAARHYLSSHYREKLAAESRGCEEHQCCVCGDNTAGASKKPGISYFAHMGRHHPDLALRYLQEDGVMLPGKSPSFSEGENGYRVKKVRIDIKVTQDIRDKAKLVNAAEVEDPESEDEPVSRTMDLLQDDTESDSEPRLPLDELMRCFLCREDFNTSGQRALLSHYSRDHYRLELEHNYITKQGQTWGQDRRCGDCHLTIHSRDEYIQHLGVTHRHVLQVSIFWWFMSISIYHVTLQIFFSSCPRNTVCPQTPSRLRKKNRRKQASDVRWSSATLRRRPRSLCWSTC